MGVVESGAGRPRRDPEDLGDLRRSEPFVVMEDEDRPLFRRQPPEPAFELVPVGEREQLIGRRRTVHRQDPQVGRASAFAGSMVDALANDEAMEPGVEPLRIAESPQVTPGDHQRVLHGILGAVDIAKDPVRDREQAVHSAAHQVDECRLVATLRRLDEVAVHVLHP